MGIAFKSRLGRSGRGFRRGTEDIVGTMLGVDNQLAQNAGALQQGQLDNLLFGTANKRQDFQTKVADEGRFNQGLEQLLQAGDPRSLDTLQNVFLNRSNPNAPALAKGTTQKTQNIDRVVSELGEVIRRDPSNVGAQRDLLSILSGKTLNDAAISDIARREDARTVQGQTALDSVQVPIPGGGTASLGDLARSGSAKGSLVEALGLFDAKKEGIEKKTELTGMQITTEFIKQNKLNIDVERVQLLNELSDEELDQAQLVNPEKLREAIAEADEAEERVQREMQKMETEAQKTNATIALTELRGARNRLAIAKISGESGMKAKDFGSLVDKRMKLLLGAVPNNPEFEAQTIQTPQRFVDSQGETHEKGEFVLATLFPQELLRAVAIRQVQGERDATRKAPETGLVDLLTAPTNNEVGTDPLGIR